MKEPMRMQIFTENPELFESFRDTAKAIAVGDHEFVCVGVKRMHLSVTADFQEVIRLKAGTPASGLPSLESTVRIVPGDTTIWDVAEQFVGVDCRLKAVFMLDETQMVAVENIGSRQCCCFWASMVRTPEQARAEDREAKGKALYRSIYFSEPDDAWNRQPEVSRENYRIAIDAGWQQVAPDV